MRHTQISIDQHALTYNLNRVKTLAPQSKIVSMVKADAYGHGLQNCLDALQSSDYFGVACYQEAVHIRSLGYLRPITLIEGVFSEEEQKLAINHQIECVVHHQKQVEWLLKYKNEYQSKNLKVWVKLNSGMNRLGFLPQDIIPLIQKLKTLGFNCVLTMHFANADQDPHELNEYQKRLFLNVKDACAPILCSCCNSAAIFKWPDFHFDYVRPGIMLYGASPFANISIKALDLKPVMTFSTQIMAVHHVPKGQTIGYGSTFTAPQDMKIAIISVGYGDGFPRVSIFPNHVMIKEQRAPLVGRVSMDMTAVDVSHIKQCEIGDSVELWGKTRLVDEVAQTNGTIGYELLCRLTQRPLRIKK